MDREDLRITIEKGNIEWHRHTLERMIERGISREAVKEVLLSGELIEDYPGDKPFPSALFFERVEGEPLHVVAAFDPSKKCCLIVTAYRPDLKYFEPDFKTRRKT